MKLSSVRVLIWDFDGTLYRSKSVTLQAIRNTEINVICAHTSWTKEKATEEFYKLHRVVTPSGTKVVSMLTGISPAQASKETSSVGIYGRHLAPDRQLMNLFRSLKEYRHFMLVNGTREDVLEGLSVLDIAPSIFREIVTSEVVGVTKPEPDGFRYIMQKTGLPPEAHLMIGDREAVDLAPAKALGMHTCLVWSDTKSDIADITLPTVYDIVNIP